MPSFFSGVISTLCRFKTCELFGKALFVFKGKPEKEKGLSHESLTSECYRDLFPTVCPSCWDSLGPLYPYPFFHTNIVIITTRLLKDLMEIDVYLF